MISPIDILPWDSRVFGRRIARYKGTVLTPTLARAAIKACLAQRAKCLYFLASSNDVRSIGCAETHGFRLVDIRVTLARDLEAEPLALAASGGQAAAYRPAHADDIPALKRLAKSLFLHSRFALDPGFPADAHEKLFAEWVAKSVRGRFDDWVGVAEIRGRLAGFVSCRKTGRGAGAIGLVGVARSFRRRGLGRALVDQGLGWFRVRRIRHVSVVTQGRAIGAQRLYQACGFRTSRVDLWYHKWF